MGAGMPPSRSSTVTTGISTSLARCRWPLASASPRTSCAPGGASYEQDRILRDRHRPRRCRSESGPSGGWHGLTGPGWMEKVLTFHDLEGAAEALRVLGIGYTIRPATGPDADRCVPRRHLDVGGEGAHRSPSVFAIMMRIAKCLAVILRGQVSNVTGSLGTRTRVASSTTIAPSPRSGITWSRLIRTRLA